MKADELKALIREVLQEQEDKMNLKTGSKTPQALKAEILETIKNIDVEMTNELRDQNRVNLSLEFTVGNQIDLQELTFTVQGTN